MTIHTNTQTHTHANTDTQTNLKMPLLKILPSTVIFKIVIVPNFIFYTGEAEACRSL